MILALLKLGSIMLLVYLVYIAGRADGRKEQSQRRRYFLLIQTADELKLELVTPIEEYWAQRAEVVKEFAKYNDRKDVISLEVYRMVDIYMQKVDIQEYFAYRYGTSIWQ